MQPFAFQIASLIVTAQDLRKVLRVGIVKFVHNQALYEEEAEVGIEAPEEQTLELTRYEIKSLTSE